MMSGRTRDFRNKLINFSGDWYLIPRDRLQSRTSQDYGVHFVEDRNTPSHHYDVELSNDKDTSFQNYGGKLADDRNTRFQNYGVRLADGKTFQDYGGNISDVRTTPVQDRGVKFTDDRNIPFQDYGGNLANNKHIISAEQSMQFNSFDFTEKTKNKSFKVPGTNWTDNKSQFYADSIVLPRGTCIYKNGYCNSVNSCTKNALLTEGISSSLCKFDSFRTISRLKGDEKKPDVTMEQRIVGNILKKNADFLSRHLVLSPSVLDRLHSAGIISDVARKQIIFQEQRKQVPMLLQNLEGHGLVTIRKFLEVLRETGHGWLVSTIMDTEAMSYEDVSLQSSRRQPEISSNRHPKLLTPDWYGKPAPPPPVEDPKPQPAYVSLGKLLDDRQRLQEDSKHVRGQLQPKVVLEEVMGRPLRFSKTKDTAVFEEDVPTSLVNLQGYFKGQTVTNEQTLSVLKQEEIAIRELLDQNVRDQAKLRRNQHALVDIGQRLEEIHTKASDVYNPTTDAQLSRYRLAQLNQIPWRDEN